MFTPKVEVGVIVKNVKVNGFRSVRIMTSLGDFVNLQIYYLYPDKNSTLFVRLSVCS